MNIDQKIYFLNTEISTLIISRINGYHNSVRSRVDFLNALVVIVDENELGESYVGEMACDVKAYFDKYLSGDAFTTALTGYSLCEQDMSFEYDLQVQFESLDVDLVFSFNSNHPVLTPDKANKIELDRLISKELDDMILHVQVEISFGSLQKP